jgi:hypothetical protein
MIKGGNGTAKGGQIPFPLGFIIFGFGDKGIEYVSTDNIKPRSPIGNIT